MHPIALERVTLLCVIFLKVALLSIREVFQPDPKSSSPGGGPPQKAILVMDQHWIGVLFPRHQMVIKKQLIPDHATNGPKIEPFLPYDH